MTKSVFGSRAAEAKGPRYTSATRTFQVAEDIMPIAELKATLSETIRGLDTRPRPLVVTLNGKPAAVIMSPREFDQLTYRQRVVDAIDESLADIEAGRVYDGEEVFAQLDRRYASMTPRSAKRKKA